MAAADDHFPGDAADGQAVAVAHAAIAGGRQADPRPVQVAARSALLGLLGVEPGAMIELPAGRDESLADIERQSARLQPFGAAGPELGAAPLAPPAGQAHVVGMKMGRQDPRYRPAGHEACQILPTLARPLVGEAGIDQRPAGAFCEQPEVDVVEREGQREAHPEQPGRQLAGLAIGGERDPLVGQGVGGRDAGG